MFGVKKERNFQRENGILNGFSLILGEGYAIMTSYYVYGTAVIYGFSIRRQKEFLKQRCFYEGLFYFRGGRRWQR